MHNRRVVALLLCSGLLATGASGCKGPVQEVGGGNMQDQYRLWYDEAAPDTGAGFENESLPIGNGHMGVCIFGGTECETLSVSEETMFNPPTTTANCPMEGPDGEEYMRANGGGFANLCHVSIEFGHKSDMVSNYQRDLVLDTAEAHVTYDYEGVTYQREYFSSYPDNVTVMKLSASEAGKLTFTLRPEATYVRDYCVREDDGMGKTGVVTGEGDTLIVFGTLQYYNINYEAQLKVIPVGGTMTLRSQEGESGAVITVENADSAVVILAVGTNYEQSLKTFTAKYNEKLDINSFPHDKVTARIHAAAEKGYDALKKAHREDFQELFNRADVDFGGKFSAELTTDQLLYNYKRVKRDPYLEELMFQYGRYLLIASSRQDSLPTNLQGVWNYYCSSAWAGQYVYNINLPMSYWPAFNTNLVELYEAHVKFFDTFFPVLQSNADTYLQKPDVPTTGVETIGTGKNGICWSTAVTPFVVRETVSTTHSGPGSVAFTTLLFWDYYDFTRDETILEKVAYPYLEGSATFLSKTLQEYDGKWLVANSASPENNTDWITYYRTVGTAFDQQLIYENYLKVLECARVLGYTDNDHPILKTIEERMDKLDHVIVGKSGQIKEYREEEYYGDLGEYTHRHLSQLMGLYPGTSINSKTDAWLDAARYTLGERGLGTTGWSIGHRINAWARVKDGEMSYKEVAYMINTRIMNNLWDTHPPFQIDGNFGYTSGVAEMLLQSHEGYLEILPALPKAWNTGSYRGLTARGNFAVDAAWEDGSATKITVTANAGGDCGVKYFNISTAKVTDSKGNPVSFTADGQDIIRFVTTKGETYTITNLSKRVTVEAPADLTLSGSFDLSWEPSSDAVSYRVYRAINSQATYELVAENITDTAYAYRPTDLNEGDQITLRVTAVDKNGVESAGITALGFAASHSQEEG